MSEERESMESLLARVTDRRRELLTSVVDRRTRHFCMVLEDLFDPHNISAVIRTAEVFGLQDVHIIEEDNAYSVNKSILKGSYKWMSLYLYKKRMLCMEKLRAKGYKIAVASTNTTNSVLDLDLSHYEQAADASRFVYLSADIHDAVHTLYKCPMGWKKALENLANVLQRMDVINGLVDGKSPK